MLQTLGKLLTASVSLLVASLVLAPLSSPYPATPEDVASLTREAEWQSLRDQAREDLRPPAPVFAHRGGLEEAPENTLKAVRNAFAKGAAGVEVDILLTVDGIPVVTHDYEISLTTDRKGRVSELPAEFVTQARVRYPNAAEYSNETIPLLADVLAAVPPQGEILLDLKDNGIHLNAALSVIGAMLTERDLWGRTLFLHQDLETAKAIGARWPHARVYAASDRNTNVQSQVEAAGLEGIVLVKEAVTWGVVKQAQAHGKRVIAPAGTDPFQCWLVSQMGVDALLLEVPRVPPWDPGPPDESPKVSLVRARLLEPSLGE